MILDYFSFLYIFRPVLAILGGSDVLSFIAWSVNKHLAFCFTSRFCFPDSAELHKIFSSILTNFSE
jgi:hypothetical protein